MPRPDRKTKRRKSSKGPQIAALITAASPQEFTTEETSGLLASRQPQIGQGCSPARNIELPTGGDDHQQGPMLPVKSPLEDGQSGLSSYIGGVTTTETLQETAAHAVMEPVAAAGTGRASSAPFSAPSLKPDERTDNDGGVASAAGYVEPVPATRREHRHHEEVQRGASTKGESNGGPDYGGRAELGEEATSEKILSRNVAVTVAAALTVRLQAHRRFQYLLRRAINAPGNNFAVTMFLNLHHTFTTFANPVSQEVFNPALIRGPLRPAWLISSDKYAN